jgi:hypothetical protein
VSPGGDLRLVSAPPIRLRDLLAAHQPRSIASVKWLQGGHKTLYSVEAMRGIAPGSIAWALYRNGLKRPVETGVTDVSALSPGLWVAVRPQGPQLVTLASRAPSLPRLALLAAHTFPSTRLALVPAKPARGARSGTQAKHHQKGRARRS